MLCSKSPNRVAGGFSPRAPQHPPSHKSYGGTCLASAWADQAVAQSLAGRSRIQIENDIFDLKLPAVSCGESSTVRKFTIFRFAR